MICEPPAAHSPQCSYQFTKAVYANTSNLTYSILTLLFGGLLSFIYGLSCGVISFFFVWLVTPFLRAWLILLGLAGKVWLSFVKCFYDPYFESCGRIFSNVNITFRSGTIQNVWLGYFLLFLKMQLNFIIRDFVLQLPIFFSAQFFTASVSFKFAQLDFSGTMLSTLAHKPGAGGGFCDRGGLEI